MEGFRSHNDWPYNLQPSSNLSASATPFSVIRSASSDVSPPLNPIHFPDHSQSYEDANPIQAIPHIYDFFADPVTELDSSNPHSFGYSGLHVPPFSHFGQCSNATETSPVKRQVYVPPHVKISPPPPPEAQNHTTQWSNTTKTSLFERKTYVPPYVNFSSAPPVFQNYTGQCSNTTKTSLLERKTYVPEYAPSTYVTLVRKGQDDTSSSVVPNQWSSYSVFNSFDDYADNDKSLELGFAGQSSNQFAEFNNGKGKCVGVGSSFSSNQANINNAVAEDRMKRGYQLIKDNHGDFPHMIDTEKHSMPTTADQFNDKSCWWKTVKPAPVDFSGATVLQPSSFSVETHQEVPLKLAVDSGNHHFSYTGVHNKDSRQQGVDMVFTTPMTGSGTDMNIGNNMAAEDLGHYNFDNIEEAYPLPIPKTGSSFYLENFCMPLERNEFSSNNSMISDMDSSRDAADYLLKARHGFQNPNPSLDNLSLRLSATEEVNSTEKSFVCGSLCNPAVDSPCWRGAPTASFTHYEFSVALPTEHVHKNEESVGNVIQDVQNFLPDGESNDKKPDGRSNSQQVHIGIVDQESSSEGSLKKFSETKLASENFKSDGAVNTGHFWSESSCDYGLKYQHGVTETKKTSVPTTKPTDCESGSSHNEDQVIKENKLVAQKSHTLWTGSADAGCNENHCLESGTSFTAKPARFSPSSVADALTTPEKSVGNLNVQMLVNTMQNLSELLLNHCLNDACELKEQDSDILKNVITNLTCVLKNAEQITPAEEFLLHQSESSGCAGEPCELQQNVHFKRAQLTRTEPEDSKVTFGPKLHFGFGKPLQLLDFFPQRNDAEMTKTANMTKALKKILGENFDDESTECQSELYKNLWLEAEAALCSLNYRARYNQMKIEMEKHSYKQRDMEELSKHEVIPSLSNSQSSATKVHNNPNTDSSDMGLPILDATNPKTGFKLFNENKPNLLTPSSLVQKYTVSGTNKEVAESDEASIMARYHVLMGRGDSIDLDKPSDISDKSTAREIDNQNEGGFCQEAPVPGKAKADYKEALLARFHILKSRVEDSSSVSLEEKWLDGVGSSGKGKEDSIITENTSEDKSLDAHLNSYINVEKSIPKEIHPDMDKLFGWEHV